MLLSSSTRGENYSLRRCLHWQFYTLKSVCALFFFFLNPKNTNVCYFTVAGQYLLVLGRKSRYSQERNYLQTEIQNNLAEVQKGKLNWSSQKEISGST